jgi:hypothetical protein
MTPEQISVLTAIVAIFDKVGSWPILTVILAIVICPWIGLWLFSRNMEKRHEAVIAMYEHNVKLVKSYELMAGQQADMIRISTAATQELTTYLRTRTPCYQMINNRITK